MYLSLSFQGGKIKSVVLFVRISRSSAACRWWPFKGPILLSNVKFVGMAIVTVAKW